MKGVEGSATWSHSIDPFIAICPYDLHGQCADKMCPMQHAKDYSLTRFQLASDILAYLHISPETSLFNEQSLQRQEPSKRQQFEELQKKLEAMVQQLTHNELANLSRSQIVKDMVGSVNRSRISSLLPGEPIPEHHIMPGSRSWRPINSRKRLHRVADEDTQISDIPSKVHVSEVSESISRTPEQSQKIWKALEFAETVGSPNYLKDPERRAISEETMGRYFGSAVEGRSGKELKHLIKSKSEDVTAWLELAKWTGHNNQHQTPDQVQKAKLSVLARALEVNNSSKDVWEVYVKEFAATPFNFPDHVLNLCREAVAYVDSEFVYYLVSSAIRASINFSKSKNNLQIYALESNVKKKLEIVVQMINRAIQSHDSQRLIQNVLLHIKLSILAIPRVSSSDFIKRVCSQIEVSLFG